ncbi:ATP-dependent helicase [Nanchangia anserum]|uniref:DNA 3'-5' helicase n=1 Tax=Nanchangia anserum TaxID=2692125 RepID=A0A8I0KWN7_9ACTO|nr:ATP-dependent DNA helicase [Nanchangia anserum]MBD3690174.1 ATP-dependent helicase [Nanchangia anserum]QOX82371.1 ATP-dependent helicase [Nanchangia anserum]
MSATTLSAADLAAALGSLDPTEEQTRVIEADLEPLLVVAGAGSGKTATMTQRVIYLVATGQVRADEVLGLTFTRKAAAELNARISAQLEALASALPHVGIDRSRMPTVSTYNAFASQLVRDYGVQIGVDPSARLLDDAERHQIIGQLIDARAENLAGDKARSSLVETTVALADQLANHRLSGVDGEAESGDRAQACAQALRTEWRAIEQAIEADTDGKSLTVPMCEVRDSWLRRVELMDVVTDYTRYKRDHNLVDFADQILLARDLVRDEAVRDAVGQRYRAIFLDEFQDTSEGQMELLSRLFAGAGVTAVGDPNQAIYSWRGASQAALHSFHELFGGQASLTLSTAWRNDQAILDLANTVSAELALTPEYWRGKAATASIPTLRLHSRPGAGKGTIYRGRFAHIDDEIDAIAEYLQAHADPARSAAILVRTRTHIPALAERLRSRDIPVVLDAVSLLEIPGIVDVCAALHVSANAARGDHLMRLLTNVGVGAADLEVLWRWARERARDAYPDDSAQDRSGVAYLLDAVDSPPPIGWGAAEYADAKGFSPAAHARVARLSAVLRQLRHASCGPLPRLVERAVQLLGVDLDMAAISTSALAQRDVTTFIALAENYARTAERPTVASFLTWLDIAKDSASAPSRALPPPTPGAVTITTIHQAKGLEWDCVIVPFQVEDTFPQSTRRATLLMKADDELPGPLRSDADYLPELALGEGLSQTAILANYRRDEHHRHILEERRLAYVAYTRARTQLILTSSWYMSTDADARVRDESRFLADTSFATLPVSVPADVTKDEAGDIVAALTDNVAAATWEEPRLFPALRHVAALVDQRGVEWSDELPLTDETVRDLVAGRRAPHGPVEAAIVDGRDCGLGDPLGQVARVLAQRAQAGHRESVQLPRRLTTTGLARLGDDEELARFLDDLRRPVPPQRSGGAEIGSRVHEVLAIVLRSLANGGEREQLRELVNATYDELEPKQATQVKALVDVVIEGDLLEEYAPVEVEYDVATVIGETVIAARLDALMRSRSSGRLVICDWKTDRLSPSDPVPPAYVTQLCIYRMALAETLGIAEADIDLRLVFLRANRIVDVDEVSPHARQSIRGEVADVLERARDRARGIYLT